jgi:hypothetical protein
MKKNIYLFICFFIAFIGNVKPACASGGNPAIQINGNDSIVFNVTEADCFSDKIQFPVYLASDEDIFAIDFALKFDVTQIAYDSIIILKPYLLASINYNTADSTLRFSCFSIQPVESGVNLFNLRFRKIASVDSVGFNHITTFLNGDSCSNRVNQYISHPVLSPAGPLSINTGDSITLVVDSLPGYSYFWSTGDTSTSIRISSQGIYSVTATNIHGCTAAGSITVNPGIPLPVELLYFKSTGKENKIILEWSTATETENDFFTLEKLNADDAWSIPVRGNGNSSIPITYSITDSKPVEQFNYYCLKQTDYNGKTKTVGYASCFFEKESGSIHIYPNPVHEELRVEAAGDGVLQIYNSYGEAVSDIIPVIPGTAQIINVRDLKPGLYFLKRQSGTSQESRMFYCR